MAEKRREMVRFVCVGRRFSGAPGASVTHEYLDERNKTCRFKKALGGGAKDAIGGLYEGEVQLDADGEIEVAIGRWKWCGQFAADGAAELVIQWRAEDEAAFANKQHEDRRRRALQDNPIFEALLPIKAAYRRTNGVGKRAILAQIIEFITR